MSFLIRKHHGLYHFTGISRLAIVGLIISVAAAFINTIWAVYLDGFFESAATIGFFTSFLMAVSFVSFFLFVPLVERSDKAKIFSYALVFFAVWLVLFAVIKNFYIFVFLAITLAVVQTLRITSYGIIIKNNSPRKKLSRNEGLVYTFMNFAWVIGPLTAGYVAAQFGLSWVFLMASAFTLSGLAIFKSFKVRDRKSKKIHGNVMRNFIDFFRSKERTVAYVLGAGINLWWGLIFLFVPLMIIRSGLGEIWIGYFLFATGVPLLSLEYVFSKKAGKYGFKRYFKLGYLSVAILSLACFFVSNIYVVLLLLAVASVGMAALEPTTEAYFFDILKKGEDHRFYGPYNTAMTAGAFVGRITAAALLLFLPFNFLFILFGVFMFGLFLLSFKARDVVEDGKR